MAYRQYGLQGMQGSMHSACMCLKRQPRSWLHLRSPADAYELHHDLQTGVLQLENKMRWEAEALNRHCLICRCTASTTGAGKLLQATRGQPSRLCPSVRPLHCVPDLYLPPLAYLLPRPTVMANPLPAMAIPRCLCQRFSRLRRSRTGFSSHCALHAIILPGCKRQC